MVAVAEAILVREHIGLAWGVKDDLKKLQHTLDMILAVTDEAEKEQAKTKAVNLWLRRLKDAAYDADDILDQFSYEAMRRREDSPMYKFQDGW
ncbi:hypothetical protein BVC80_1615g11 [Macleaya cordata]|uniref:Disease resistance N-terminal domain-containing protein n=1 Tax=Macleaya cordata TaxID=56857 RepID=A0A200QDZ3_MACCD|nr:hypothetical protein BVC80_1615g11 [Macleaya cordata]